MKTWVLSFTRNVHVDLEKSSTMVKKYGNNEAFVMFLIYMVPKIHIYEFEN